MSFTCPRCGRVSHHPQDAVRRYCGVCHVFADDLLPVTRQSLITGETHTFWLAVTQQQLDAYQAGEAMLQEVFPHLPGPEREFIKSGITPEEWQRLVIGEVEDGEQMITNLADLAKLLGTAQPTETGIRRALFIYSECGIRIDFTPTGFRLYASVEGHEPGTSVYPLAFPCTGYDVVARIEAVEAEARELWNWANDQDRDTGTPPPDVAARFAHLGPQEEHQP